MDAPSLAPPPDDRPAPFACWCVLEGDHRFVYLYGPAAACQAVVAGLDPRDYLPRPGCRTRDMARISSELAAAHIRTVYGGAGAARAVPVEDYAPGAPAADPARDGAGT